MPLRSASRTGQRRAAWGRVASRGCGDGVRWYYQALYQFRMGQDSKWFPVLVRDWVVSADDHRGGWPMFDETAQQAPPYYFSVQMVKDGAGPWERSQLDSNYGAVWF